MNDHCPPFAADCAVRLAADLIAHTWDPVVLMALRTGRRRRIDLLSDIAGVSDKVLTQTLHRLHANGLVVRITTPADRSVAYELSELGGSLADGPLAALGQWAIDHADQVLAAQEHHSAGSGNRAAVR
ncbi:winged helix-turn-helix transcriptional regulator [Streptomyces rhizosphaerihabitans]|uniref:winged helix-turn-helix transcriptional regulator n=1 Tax=Streptomyces rhizosphaerihabitans TaxID=1266770 RepID=UPI0021C1C76B|nr:helix-turn-helix transcriptional regulator [Streptomyces rhizosphaerihabitans]MCT9009018.1 helix-turn-helix transcriptional regulator [Streptomyces rhizosphaerihabitans]